MSVLAQKHLQLPNNWTARHYQKEQMNYMFSGGVFPERKRAYDVWHRRAGKDSTSINTLAVASQMRVGTYWHLLPTLNQGRKVVWNGIDGQGRRVIYQGFPRELITSVNENDMTLKLGNESIYQVVGSDNYDALVGTNPLGVVLSEWSLSDPACWNYLRPILNENGGFAVFITTPRGRNHAWEMYKMACKSDNWFTSFKTVNDTFREDGTPVIDPSIIEQEREEGVPEEIIQQEYFCSFEGINYGSIFGRQLRKYQATNQFAFQYDPAQLVFTAWDIGHRDATAVIFYQIVRDEIHVIDFVEGSGGDADDWLERLRTEFPYIYGTVALPHDAKNKTFATKYTPYERFVAAKLAAYCVPNTSVAQGINAARAITPFVFWNTGNKGVVELLEHLEEYQYEWDEKTETFSMTPLHNKHSHPADAYRMLALSQNVIEISSRNARAQMARKRGPDAIMTPLGRALNLENLFRDRETQYRGPRRV